VTRAILGDRGYPLEGYNPDIVVAKGAQLVWSGAIAQDTPRATGERADWIKVT